MLSHLQTGEELGELGEERQQNEPDEVCLRRRFGHFVSVHERSHRKPFEFLCVALWDNTTTQTRTLSKKYLHQSKRGSENLLVYRLNVSE